MWQRILVSVGVIALVAGKPRGANNFAETDMQGVCTGAKTLREAGSAASYVVEEMQKESERLTAILGQLWLVTGAAQAANNDTVVQAATKETQQVEKKLAAVRDTTNKASALSTAAAAISARLHEFVAMASAMTGKSGGTGYKCIGNDSPAETSSVTQDAQIPNDCKALVTRPPDLATAKQKITAAATVKLTPSSGHFTTATFNAAQSSGPRCPLTVKGTGSEAGLVQSGKVIFAGVIEADPSGGTAMAVKEDATLKALDTDTSLQKIKADLQELENAVQQVTMEKGSVCTPLTGNAIQCSNAKIFAEQARQLAQETTNTHRENERHRMEIAQSQRGNARQQGTTHKPETENTGASTQQHADTDPPSADTQVQDRKARNGLNTPHTVATRAATALLMVRAVAAQQ
ncbi:variant surface glycoprotein (VSG), putative [Trypanosoma vivax Y486]|uniref:Variant surface glycoprotein (VSG), putative n=1 Tax=Trypanosoma vivax (strain Y486) TaxID=1055687 RepID=F9WKF9_TRYVY|nr:variant surface glycoprotein (VSG), putative [Trypanosoma vivax Y486]|eukprot:CCD17979.1 variant surface glycoprotein (VSG), putative [Trypanosoma vivax Y486]